MSEVVFAPTVKTDTDIKSEASAIRDSGSSHDVPKVSLQINNDFVSHTTGIGRVTTTVLLG